MVVNVKSLLNPIDIPNAMSSLLVINMTHPNEPATMQSNTQFKTIAFDTKAYNPGNLVGNVNVNMNAPATTTNHLDGS